MLIYNTQTRKKEEFQPITPGKASIYACGPTVYNYFHIGNARAFIFFDVVRRYFEYRGYEVTYVQNITDIDDKIIAQANEENISFTLVAEKYTRAFLEDTAALGIKPPTFQPRATEVIDEI
ncbi:MAG TPA: class I tRNA ligase family protein, partial [Candidatus Cloacimonas sp.]|nr:class I tRNA ligase family protein [Candidatus Cloacimonas sp.]